MFYINDVLFYEKPGSCGTCSFYMKGGSSMAPDANGWCTLFDERHKSYIYLPRRCEKLFNKAIKFPEGSKLVITT